MARNGRRFVDAFAGAGCRGAGPKTGLRLHAGRWAEGKTYGGSAGAGCQRTELVPCGAGCERDADISRFPHGGSHGSCGRVRTAGAFRSCGLLSRSTAELKQQLKSYPAVLSLTVEGARRLQAWCATKPVAQSGRDNEREDWVMLQADFETEI